jgi:phage/plasmid-like protein (TIGR03299 family)
VWLLAKLPGEIRVADDDITEKYLLLSNGHDGLSSVQVKFTPIRVVCNNTLTMALRRGAKAIRVVHTRDMKLRLETARQNLHLINSHYQEIEGNFAAMVKVKMNNARLSSYLTVVFPDPEEPNDERAFERECRDRARAAFLFENGTGNKLKGVAGTLWAAYNGVAELVDHGRRRRSTGQHLEHIWFGSGAAVKARAFKAATVQAEQWRE